MKNADLTPLACRIVPLAYLALAVAIVLLLHLVLPGVRVIVFPWTLLGIILLVLGVALALAAALSLKRHRTTIKHHRRPKGLVTTGVFRISRNPIYLGFVLVLLGTAVLVGSLTPFAVVLLFAVFLDIVFVRFEERKLEETFGEAWLHYRKQVRRWL